MIVYGYSITEHYDDEAPELFGGYASTKLLSVEDVIQLKWLSGADAYKVEVIAVDNENLKADVRAC